MRTGRESSSRRSASSSGALQSVQRLSGSKVQSRERRRASSAAQASTIAFEDDRTVVRITDLDETPVPGQENAMFRKRLFDEIAITAAALSDCRVVAGDAQPAAQARQHLVT